MIVPRHPPETQDVVRHYDDLDRYYREIWGEHVHHGLWETGRETPQQAVDALVRRVADLAEIGSGDVVCDVGSGYGATARWLARERGARVTAITLSPIQHAGALAAASEDPEPRYVLADWMENAEDGGAFDAVLAVESLSHLPDANRALAEVARVLRPGGRFVACVWLARENPAPWEVRLLLRPICEEGRLARLLTPSELRAGVVRAGLRPEPLEDLSGKVARTWTVCLLRALRRVWADAEARRFLADRSQSERVFARTLVRLRLAFLTGSLHYGVLKAGKPGEG